LSKRVALLWPIVCQKVISTFSLDPDEAEEATEEAVEEVEVGAVEEAAVDEVSDVFGSPQALSPKRETNKRTGKVFLRFNFISDLL